MEDTSTVLKLFATVLKLLATVLKLLVAISIMPYGKSLLKVRGYVPVVICNDCQSVRGGVPIEIGTW